MFDHYCLLRGKETENASELVCSIPVSRTCDKIFVDYLAFPRGEGCLYSHPWTHMYSPTCTNQVIGNASACSTLLDWLQCWRKRYRSGNSTRPMHKGKILDDRSSDPDFLPNNKKKETYDSVSSVVLLYGPHGSGKTATVYACAMEAGFKVCIGTVEIEESRVPFPRYLRSMPVVCVARPSSYEN